MSFLKSILIVAAVSCLAIPEKQLPAQIIHGRLLEDVTNSPVSGATIQLLTAYGEELNRIATSSATGIFMMRVEPGRYMIRIRRLGYAPLTSAVITLDDNSSFEATYRVSPVALRLATSRIVARRDREWGRDGWQRRKDLDLGGVFISRGDLGDRTDDLLFNILVSIPGLRSSIDGLVESTKGWRCMQFMVNRLPVRAVPEYSNPQDYPYPTLQELVPTGSEVMGIEIFREFKEVPPEFRMDAWPIANARGATPPPRVGSRLPSGEPPPCGLINVWTRAAW